MSRNIFNSIKSGIERGVYTTVRLVRIEETGKRQPLIPYNKISGTKDQALAKLEQIKFQLEKKLDPGIYSVEARMGNMASASSDKFEYIVKAPVMLQQHFAKKEDPLQDDVIDKTNEQQSTMNEVTLEDHIDLVRENEKLKGDIKFLQLQIELLEREQKTSALSEPASSGMGNVMKLLDEHVPTAMSIINKFIDQRDISNKLKERELSLAENGGVKKKKKIMVDRKAKKLLEMELLYDQDADEFERQLDQLEQSDPETYGYICEKMDLIDSEEEEEDQEEEQE